MPPLRRMRRRPIARAAMIGGTGYAVGRSRATSAQREADQEQRLEELEQQQQYAPPPPPVAAAPVPAASPPMPAAPAAPAADPVAQLKQLADLHTAGALSDEEFAHAKRTLLGL